MRSVFLQPQTNAHNAHFLCNLAALLRWVWLAWALSGIPAWGLNPELSCKQLSHTGWTYRDAYALAAVEALAQTTDGYIWLGTDRGLVRFNGTRFSAWTSTTGETLPSGKITALSASSKGGLWAAIQGEVVELRGNQVKRYDPLNGVEGGAVLALAEDDSGNLWVGGSQRRSPLLATIRQGSAHTLDTSSWPPQAAVTSLLQDRRGHIWIGTSAGVYEWSEGKLAGSWLTRPAVPVEAIESTSSGEIVALDGRAHEVRKFADGTWKPWVQGPLLAKSLVKSLLVDRDGCLWIGTVGQGLFRVCNGSTERFAKQDGLTGDSVLSLMEDREGDLWVGTSNGLDRFRDPRVSRISTMEGLSGNTCTAVCASRDGSVWVGTSTGGLDRVQGRRIGHYEAPPHKANTVVLSLHEDESGRLWAGTTGGLCYRTAAGFLEVRAAGGKPLDRVVAMADSHGVLWAADSRLGLFRIVHGRAGPLEEAVPNQNDIFDLSTDRQGSLWIGYYHGGVSVVGGGARQFFGVESGLAGGPVQAIYQDGGGAIWVGTGKGLSRFRNGRWTRWDSRHGLPQGVQGITTTAEGDLWLLTAAGMLRLDMAQMNNTPDSAPSSLSFRVYGPLDGIQFSETRRMVNPRLTRSPDGDLWIGTDDGLSRITPGRLRNNAVSPPVEIEQVLVDGRALDISSGRSEFRGRQVEIQFAALSLGISEPADVRYRLEGFDQEWHSAKSPMRIAYGRLPPGAYRFHAIASNPDGVWSTAGATVNLQKLPEFNQTLPFWAMCTCALTGLIYLLHRLRMRVLRAQFRLVLRERTRIARELHDTLLQGFAGTLYLLKAALVELEKSPEAGRQRLVRAIEQAGQSLREARQSLVWLRSTALEDQNLAEALTAAGKRIVEDTSILFDVEVTGQVRQPRYETEAALYVVAREAINNATTHAHPTRINLKLAYSSDRIRLSVEDDGIGFDLPEALAKNNHWGLAGMQERVKAIHAEMTVDSQPGRGTRIEIVAPTRRPLHAGELSER